MSNKTTKILLTANTTTDIAIIGDYQEVSYVPLYDEQGRSVWSDASNSDVTLVLTSKQPTKAGNFLGMRRTSAKTTRKVRVAGTNGDLIDSQQIVEVTITTPHGADDLLVLEDLNRTHGELHNATNRDVLLFRGGNGAACG
jgi:hypothetical protein